MRRDGPGLTGTSSLTSGSGRQRSAVPTAIGGKGRFGLAFAWQKGQIELMDRIERNIQVSFRHQVHFTQDVFSPKNSVLKDTLTEGEAGICHKALVVVDASLLSGYPELTQAIETYFAAFPKELELVCPPLVIPGGEQAKSSFSHVTKIQTYIDRHHIDRHSYVIAVGGGALLDMVGLAASTAHRGVRHVRIPTTTLSQNDSGVGVKNGINSFDKKNFIGTFTPPFAVINDFALLSSLSDRDKLGGYAEAVKVALIRDKSFFETLERDAEALRKFDTAAMQRLIYRCAELHLDHIATSGDPFEFGTARPLDFGHWSAHKLEQLSDYRIRHGEAVAIGIALDVIYSGKMGYLEETAIERVLNLFERLGFELYVPELLEYDDNGKLAVLSGLEEFREHLGGRLTITLLKAIGHGFDVHTMDGATVIESIYELRDRYQEKSARKEEIVA